MKYYIIANTRDQFCNEYESSSKHYNDHPSRESIDFITSELNKIGYDVEFYGGVEKLVKAYDSEAKFRDTLFLNFSDGLSQKSRKAQSAIILELLNASYAGSDPLSLLIAGNKSYTKKLVSEYLNVARGQTIFSKTNLPIDLTFPVVLKPNKEGSSLGISQESICRTEEDMIRILPNLLSRFHEIIIEEYIEGYEINCFIIGNKGEYLLVEPIICEYGGVKFFKRFVFGVEEKANRRRKEYLARNFLNDDELQSIRNATQTAFELLGMQDYARADFRLQKNGRLVFLEINGNPVISETSEIGVISKELGISFGKIVEKIIITATNRLMNQTNHE